MRGGEVLPNENHHSEGAAGKAAYHRQHCSDGMLSHQGEFSWAIPRQDPIHLLINFGAALHSLTYFGAHLVVGARPVPSAPISQGTLPGDASTTLSMTCFYVAQSVLSLLIVSARPVPSAPFIVGHTPCRPFEFISTPTQNRHAQKNVVLIEVLGKGCGETPFATKGVSP